MILEGNFEIEAKAVEGKLDGETNPYALGQIVEKSDQFMFGSSIMVAPFYGANATERKVTLPKGNWYDFYTGKLVGNNTTITVTSDDLKDCIPLFVKEGAVIPMLAEAVDQSSDAIGADLIVRHYGKVAGSFALYEDDALSFDYQQGAYRTRKISIDSKGKSSVSLSGEGPALFGEIIKTQQMSQ